MFSALHGRVGGLVGPANMSYEEQGDGELRFLAAPPPTPERMTAVLAQVHEVIRAADAIARILHGARAPPAPPPLGQVLLFP